MKILSIRQPWAWAIIHGGKDVENRTWLTRLRGRFLVHAGKGFDAEGWRWIAMNENRLGLVLPNQVDFKICEAPGTQRGGIIGSVDLVDCVTSHGSRWFFGPQGFVLRDPLPLPFEALAGQLGFFTR